MARCSIVIRCYNEEEHMDRLLRGIYQQSTAQTDSIEVIVVDSGSTDQTVEIASQYPIKLICIRKEDFSFGRALNIGCKAATGEYIVAVSAHVYPIYQDWLEHLLAPFSDPKVALVYGKQCGNESTKYSEHQIFAKWFPDQSDLDQPHPFCNNANAAIRRSLWQTIPYDETLTGLEDLDWAKRAQQLGHRIAYSAEAIIVHVHNETPDRILNRYRREAIALKRVLPQQHFHLFDFMRLVIGNISSDLYHAWHDGLLWGKVGEIFTFRLMQFTGTYRGFLHHGSISRQLKQTFYYPNGLKRSSTLASDSIRRPIDYAKENHLEKTY